MIRATETIAYGYSDPRALIGSNDAFPSDLGQTLFRSEAANRGYCLKLWDEIVPKGFGKVIYGIIAR